MIGGTSSRRRAAERCAWWGVGAGVGGAVGSEHVCGPGSGEKGEVQRTRHCILCVCCRECSAARLLWVSRSGAHLRKTGVGSVLPRGFCFLLFYNFAVAIPAFRPKNFNKCPRIWTISSGGASGASSNRVQPEEVAGTDVGAGAGAIARQPASRWRTSVTGFLRFLLRLAL